MQYSLDSLNISLEYIEQSFMNVMNMTLLRVGSRNNLEYNKLLYDPN